MFWEVFDETSSTQSTSAPSGPELDCAQSDPECSFKPFQAFPLQRSTSSSSLSKSAHSPSPPGSSVDAPKEKCPNIKIYSRPFNKEAFKKDLKNNQGQQCNQVRYRVTGV